MIDIHANQTIKQYILIVIYLLAKKNRKLYKVAKKNKTKQNKKKKKTIKVNLTIYVPKKKKTQQNDTHFYQYYQIEPSKKTLSYYHTK